MYRHHQAGYRADRKKSHPCFDEALYADYLHVKWGQVSQQIVAITCVQSPLSHVLGTTGC